LLAGRLGGSISITNHQHPGYSLQIVPLVSRKGSNATRPGTRAVCPGDVRRRQIRCRLDPLGRELSGPSMRSIQSPRERWWCVYRQTGGHDLECRPSARNKWYQEGKSRCQIGGVRKAFVDEFTRSAPLPVPAQLFSLPTVKIRCVIARCRTQSRRCKAWSSAMTFSFSPQAPPEPGAAQSSTSSARKTEDT